MTRPRPRTPSRPPRDGRKAPAGERRPYSPRVEAILAAIRAIPRGSTASYGEVAARAGAPRGARQVARVLHALSESQGLPWHRVINAGGRISLPLDGAGGLQARLLRREGLAVDAGGRVRAAASGEKRERRTRRGGGAEG